MTQKKTTAKQFVKQHSGAPYDEEELAALACDVEGEVGDAARALCEARARFDKALTSIGYERG